MSRSSAQAALQRIAMMPRRTARRGSPSPVIGASSVAHSLSMSCATLGARSRLSILPPSSKLSSARNFSLAAYLVPHPAGDFALEEGGVGAQRLQHHFLVLAEQRLHEHRRVAQVGRHAHFGDADEMALQRVVMHVAACRISLSTWRTCSPTRSRRTERPSAFRSCASLPPLTASARVPRPRTLRGCRPA